jgi:hypothetical protein
MACVNVPGLQGCGNPFSRGKALLDQLRGTGRGLGASFFVETSQVG